MLISLVWQIYLLPTLPLKDLLLRTLFGRLIFLLSRLLDILAARKDSHGLSGDILINGASRPLNFKCISGYVIQVNKPDVSVFYFGDKFWIKQPVMRFTILW